jgi:hypothetical protein
MTTMTYEERLRAFAQGKRLRRFRGMLRFPCDTTCDACGSALPNYLYGLRDMEGRRDYFVGANCLSRLSQMLVLERPFVRANITSAYLMARGLPEELTLPHQPGLDGHVRSCPTQGRNGDGHR